MPYTKKRARPGGAETTRTPIPTNPNAAPVTVGKGVLRMYDVTTGAREWEKEGQTKIPSDLQGEYQSKLIAEEVWQIIHDSGLLVKQQEQPR
jgi:hypothetical protein